MQNLKNDAVDKNNCLDFRSSPFFGHCTARFSTACHVSLKLRLPCDQTLSSFEGLKVFKNKKSPLPFKGGILPTPGIPALKTSAFIPISNSSTDLKAPLLWSETLL